MGRLSIPTKTLGKNLREVFSEGIDTYGLLTIFKKELADHFSSYRFVILFALIAMVSLISTYMTGVSLREELEGIAKPKFVFLMLAVRGLFRSPHRVGTGLRFHQPGNEHRDDE
jgi:hypothetical protein